jgi:3-hydroxyisobutyrate dehydrogenase-like beta-hydroxyacid dehydrogenase
MGRPMAERLLAQGYRLWVWNRTLAKAEALREKGAQIARTPASACAKSAIVFTMLSDFAATCEVLAGIELGGKTLVQMATIAPEQSLKLAEQARQAGGAYLEAPVLGSIPEAQAGKLLILVGGPETLFLKLSPLLEHLGKLWQVGELGKAAALKLALNQLIGSLTAAFATSLAFVQEHQIPVETFMEVLRQSALYAPTFDKKLARMLKRWYQTPNFPTEHLIKDLDLFQNAAHFLDTRLVAAARNLYAHALPEHPREDYACVFEAVLPEKTPNR